MGLDIVVYRSRKSLGIDVDSLGCVRDPGTGQYCLPNNFGPDVIPRDAVAAIRWRIGNISGVAQLREELERASNGEKLLLIEKVVYDGTHAGDAILDDLFDKLEAEIHDLQTRRDRHFFEYLNDFLAKMLEVVQIARREGNPIVFT
jgi:hypothetical protein